ncbi:MAG: DMT family transporter [Propionibacteriaceae bacterium]|nr:DMT family transporter [Propionibacteriaceae bacterium]
MASHRRLRANLLLLAAAAIWGFAFVAQWVGADVVSPFTFNSVRFGMGALVLAVIIVVRDAKRGVSQEKRALATKAVIWPGLICGAVLALAVGFQQAAMPESSAGNAAFLTALYIVLVPILGVFLGWKLEWHVVVGMIACTVGLYLICITDVFTIAVSDLLLLGAAVLFAVQIHVVDRYGTRLSALRFATSQFIGCALVSAVLAFIFDAAPFQHLELAIIPLAYGGICSVGIAYTLQVLGQRDALPSHAALIMSTEAIFGGIAGALLLGENMGLRGYSGASLMIAGIVISQLGSMKHSS